MNKTELVEHIQNETGLSKTDAAKALDAVVSGITKSLKKKTDVTLVGFGTFTVVKRKARTGRNPATGETIKIKASTQPKFKAGATLKNAVK